MSDTAFGSAGSQWDIDPLLLQAIAQVESNNNAGATSRKGAIGNMQLMPATATGLGVSDPRNPAFAVPGAAKLINDYLSGPAKGDVALALRYYQGGPDRSKWGKENAAYPAKVAAAYAALKAENNGAPVSVHATPNPATMSDADIDRMMSAGAPASPSVTASATPASPAAMSDADIDRMMSSGAPDKNAGPPIPADLAQRASQGQAIVNAATEAYKNTPPLLNPGAQAWLDRTGFGPLTRIPSAILAGGNALMAGAGETAYQTLNELGLPTLGRDVAAIVTNPQALHGTPIPPVEAPVRVVQATPPSPRFVQEYYGEGTPQNPLAVPTAAPAVAAPAVVPPGTPAPTLPRILDLIRADQAVAGNRPAFVPPNALTTPEGTVAPVQQPPNPLAARTPVAASNVLAAPEAPPTASPEVAALPVSPRAQAAAKATAEAAKLVEPTPAGPDPTEYIPGTKPTMAEIAGDPTISVLQKKTRQSNDAPFTAQEKFNNQVLIKHYEDMAGTASDVAALSEARAKQAEANLQAAFGNKAPVDAEPVAQAIETILNDPRAKENTALQQHIAPLLDRLYDENGNLKSDPEQLYGLREDVRRMTMKPSMAATPTLQHVTGQLNQVKNALDAVIEQGAPGYAKYLADYAAASRPIDAMELLQSYRPKLAGTDGMLTLNNVQRMMRDIVKDRQSRTPNPAQSIDDATMTKLWALRDYLRRRNNIDLGKPRGSDTSQLLEVGRDLGHGAVNLISTKALGPAGPSVSAYGLNMLARHSLRRRTERFLNPTVPPQAPGNPPSP